MKAWSELGGLQLGQAQDYVTQYQAAAQNQQLAAPSQAFRPSGKLGTALGTDPIEQAAATTANTATNDLYQRATLAYNGAISSYKALVKLQPANANAQFQLAQAAQTAGDTADRDRRLQGLPEAQPGLLDGGAGPAADQAARAGAGDARQEVEEEVDPLLPRLRVRRPG